MKITFAYQMHRRHHVTCRVPEAGYSQEHTGGNLGFVDFGSGWDMMRNILGSAAPLTTCNNLAAVPMKNSGINFLAANQFLRVSAVFASTAIIRNGTASIEMDSCPR